MKQADLFGNGEGGTGKSPPPPYDEIQAAWNTTAKTLKLRGCASLGSGKNSRRERIGVLWKDPFWRDNWRRALSAIGLDPFRLGRNERRWSADIDYFLRYGMVEKLIEELDLREQSEGGDYDPYN